MSKVDIAALLERVRAATGPDREIDHLVQVIVCNNGRTGQFENVEAWVAEATERGWRSPYFTASLDAIVALIERELPGWRCDFHSPRNGQIWEGVVCEHGQSRRVWVEHCASGPLALCAAFLSAKLSLSDHAQT